MGAQYYAVPENSPHLGNFHLQCIPVQIDMVQDLHQSKYLLNRLSQMSPCLQGTLPVQAGAHVGYVDGS